MNRSVPIGLMLFLVSACSTTRLINEGEYLFQGSTVEVKADTTVKIREKKLEKRLEKAAASETNKELFGFIPVKLWLYNLAGDSVPEKGVRHWMKYKLGEPPVLFRNYSVEAKETEIKYALQNNGFFHPEIRTEKIADGKKMTLLHQVNLEKPYSFNNLRYPEPTDSLTTHIKRLESSTMVRKSDQFSLEILKKERERIDAGLKKEGFYYFLDDYLYFELDTLREKREVNMELALKSGMPEEATRIYRIGRIYVHHDSLRLPDTGKPDTILHEGLYHLASDDMEVEPELLRRSVQLRTGRKYNQQDYIGTLNKLTGLGIYKYVQIKFRETKRYSGAGLDAHIYLTRNLPKSIRAEIEAVSKSNDFTGPGLDISYHDRNFNRRAATFRFMLNAGFETQLLTREGGLNNIELGAGVEWDYPVLVAPKFLSNYFENRYFNPRTRIRTGADYYNRGGLFRVNGLNLSFAYHWKETATKSHEIRLASVDFQRLKSLSEEPEVEQYLSRTYPQQFITSVRYTYTLNNLAGNDYFRDYLSVSVEPAGSLPGLTGKVTGGNENEDLISGIFGVPFAQYTRLYGDYRTYLEVSAGSNLVARFIAGVGIPYGNSSSLPYKKRFYSGGTNSLRSFPSRSVGPGTYTRPDSLSTGWILGQTGDLKLEGNLEYRVDLTRYLKTAFFVDAGNTWLYHSDEQLPGGVFEWDDFAGELAVGAGAGLRLDISFFVLRLDVAVPFRKPFKSPGNRWVFDEMDFGNKNWRQQNIVYNLAIGYPF